MGVPPSLSRWSRCLSHNNSFPISNLYLNHPSLALFRRSPSPRRRQAGICVFALPKVCNFIQRHLALRPSLYAENIGSETHSAVAQSTLPAPCTVRDVRCSGGQLGPLSGWVALSVKTLAPSLAHIQGSAKRRAPGCVNAAGKSRPKW